GENILSDLLDLSHPPAKDVGNLLLFEIGQGFSAYHAPVSDDAELTYRETASYSLYDGNEGRHVRRVPRPHLRADRIAFVIEDDAHDHLVKIGALILAVAELAYIASLALEVEGGGVEEDDIEGAEEIPAAMEQ